ncbi:hypothetical protein BC943DRAFT_381404 [Umbelopsis sp. AD052]|nr:hypothetical protein BC943DRAFT_381404 [Umbelopsis sp. AD052]
MTASPETDAMLASTSYPPASKAPDQLTYQEQLLRIARHLPCDECSAGDCTGWRPEISSFTVDNMGGQCACGHAISSHVDGEQDMERRLRVATRIDELLEEKDKLDDFDYVDEDILSLRKQMVHNAERAPSVDSLSSASTPSSIEGGDDSPIADRPDDMDERPTKRRRSSHEDAEEDASHDEDEDEEEEEEEEDDDDEEDEDSQDEETAGQEQADEENEEEDDDDEEEEDEEEHEATHKDDEDAADSDEHMPQAEAAEDESHWDDDTTEKVESNNAHHNDSTMDIDSPNTDNEQNEEKGLENGYDDHQVNGDATALNHIKVENMENDRLLDDDEDHKVNGVDADENESVKEDSQPIEDSKAAADRKESVSVLEERRGEIEFRVVKNDGAPESMILLTGLKNIFQKQLPKMPKEYIARLVYDRNHLSMALIRKPLKVIGGICYRPFDKQEFAEIVFCAISSTEQVKGYGAHLMNHLKDYISAHTNMRHFLTYADNYATGYFRKQGFTTEITLDRHKWVGYIKDYEGGTIMQCTMVPRVKYLKVFEILSAQRKAVLEKTKQYSTSHIVHPGIKIPLHENGTRSIDPLKVPGIPESGWTPEMDIIPSRPQRPPHFNQMRHLVTELSTHRDAWPFQQPVNGDEVTDYYEVIKEPMDISALEANVDNDVYTTMDMFIKDAQKIFDNCRTYNAETTSYAKCATRLERYFKERIKVWCNTD